MQYPLYLPQTTAKRNGNLPITRSYSDVTEEKPKMQKILPAQAVPPQIPDTDDPSSMRQAGEEAARAVAQMRHTAVDNWDKVAHFTRAVLDENSLSYREQERHTGVGASTVYRMALGNVVGIRAVQQFAAFAAYSSRRDGTRFFWAETLSRLNHEDEDCSADVLLREGGIDAAAASPEEIAALYARLAEPADRKAVANLLLALNAKESS